MCEGDRILDTLKNRTGARSALSSSTHRESLQCDGPGPVFKKIQQAKLAKQQHRSAMLGAYREGKKK